MRTSAPGTGEVLRWLRSLDPPTTGDRKRPRCPASGDDGGHAHESDLSPSSTAVIQRPPVAPSLRLQARRVSPPRSGLPGATESPGGYDSKKTMLGFGRAPAAPPTLAENTGKPQTASGFARRAPSAGAAPAIGAGPLARSSQADVRQGTQQDDDRDGHAGGLTTLTGGRLPRRPPVTQREYNASKTMLGRRYPGHRADPPRGARPPPPLAATSPLQPRRVDLPSRDGCAASAHLSGARAALGDGRPTAAADRSPRAASPSSPWRSRRAARARGGAAIALLWHGAPPIAARRA